MHRRKAAVTSSTIVRENAAVRYDTPTCIVSCAVVTAKTSGQSGPVDTARKYSHDRTSFRPLLPHKASTLRGVTPPHTG